MQILKGLYQRCWQIKQNFSLIGKYFVFNEWNDGCKQRKNMERGAWSKSPENTIIDWFLYLVFEVSFFNQWNAF